MDTMREKIIYKVFEIMDYILSFIFWLMERDKVIVESSEVFLPIMEMLEEAKRYIEGIEEEIKGDELISLFI